ncbi:MAG: 3-hydroxyacyl-CoA dehydrogenase NAD-binding domain-containing protein [Verrucomicrobiales bacterium]
MPNITLQTSDALATLTFDRPDSRANIFDRDTLRELDARLDDIAADPSLTGLLITSAKENIFIAGADLNTLAKAEGEDLIDLIKLGQNTFQKLAELKIPTVAAIHGACVGGGLELALACDWRVASDAKKTTLGLPETQLGIIPAWGGTTRLPRLVGLPTALSLILPGKLLKPIPALKKSLVDALAPRERLVSYARTFLEKGKRPEESHFSLHNPVSRKVIENKARHDLLEKTRGLYPAPERALEVATESLGLSLAESFEAEQAAIRELAPLPETRRLIHLYFLTETAKKRRVEAVSNRLPEEKRMQSASTPTTIAVIGAGVMGSGIAYWLATKGHRVLLQDLNHEALAKGLQSIEKELAAARDRHLLTAAEAQKARDLIQPILPDISLKSCDLVIEAAVENLDIKQKIFADLSHRTRPDTLLATNTSALPIHQLAPHIEKPERLLGLHFFNPVPRMKLVEVIHTSETSPEVLDRALRFTQSIGKLPVPVKDSPGFIVNRILLPYLLEATELFLRGSSPFDLDEAMLDFGMPMGPLRLLDEVGLDIAIHVAATLARAFPDRVRIPSALETLVKKGDLGKKTSAGFYLYDKGKKTAPNPAALALQKHQDPLAPEDIAPRLEALMRDEAQLCLDEGIAESADDINFAMIMGSGYPPFREPVIQNNQGT